jgi:type VI secretion system protein
MLSTREGSVQTLADYGLPDLNDMRMSLHDSLTRSREAIQSFIAKYEPRLSGVTVEALPRDPTALKLSFAIKGWIDIDGRTKRVSFSASLEGGGQVNVR